MGWRFIYLLAVLALAGCNPPADYALIGSAYVPAAHGDIEVERVDKGEILLMISLDRLVAPDQIEAGLTDYVIWFLAVGEEPVRQRTFDYDPEAQTGRAMVTTSLREFELRITAERSAVPERPSDIVVASQNIREK